MQKWKVLSQTDVSPSPWFPVLQHKVELPNGKIIDDYFISPLGNVAMVLPITKDNKIVFVKQYKHAVGEILIELPAGMQQKGKTIEESALAELEEETGIRTTADNLIFLGKTANNPTKIFDIIYSYLATGLEFNSVQSLDDTEEIEIVLLSPQETLEMIKNGEIWIAGTVATIMQAMLRHPQLFK